MAARISWRNARVAMGRDGSGVAPTGQSLYPRVADLRSSHTQNLTDGEIHYIIENGVAFTAMPAWSNLHQIRDGDGWKLVLYIRSLRPLTGQGNKPNKRKPGLPRIMSARTRAPSVTRKFMNTGRRRRWQTSFATRDCDRDAIIPDLATNNVAKFSKDQVAFVYGSLWKQRYFTKIGDDYFPLPVQWEVKKTTSGANMWCFKRGGDWWAAFYPPDNMHRPTGPLCDGCHSVGYDIHTKQVAEWRLE